MKFALAFAAILAVASAQFPGFPPVRAARPVSPTPRPAAAVASRASSSDQAASVLSYENDISPDGTYNYFLNTDNGIAIQAQGTPRDFGGNPPIVPVVSQGSYSFTTPEGQVVTITYIADENGFQPQGDAIPTPPAIPEAILKSIEYINSVQKKK